MIDMALLNVDALTIAYQTAHGSLKAVDGISFTLEKGSSLGLVGESGCGKTTLGMALMRLLPVNGSVLSGRIDFDGRDLLAVSESTMREIRWGEIAMIFQAAMNALNPVHRIDDQIAEAILTHAPHVSAKEAKQQARELFQQMGIPLERMRDYPHQYSGGMKQRAVIAMALSCKPKLIIADEPTTALDVIVQKQILEEINLLQKTFGISVLFISHDISIVGEVCHDIGIMYAGKLVEFGPTKEVLSAPLHPYTRLLLGSFPALTGEKVRLKAISGEAPDLTRPFSGCRFCDRCIIADEACRKMEPSWVNLTQTHRALCFKCVSK